MNMTLVDAAIRIANEEGYVVELRRILEAYQIEVCVFFEGNKVNARVDESLGEMGVVDAIKDCISHFNGTNKRSEDMTLREELNKYKQTVKQLAFDLEMAQSGRGADTAIRVQEIRRMALEQASEYVMDYGIPKSGADLEKLCNEIKTLQETRGMGIKRGLSAMEAAFVSKQ